MKLHKYFFIVAIVLSLFIMIGCAGHQRIKYDEAFLKIKPAAPLPEAVAKKQPVNLLIRIENVADARTSYKNHLDLFVNNFLIVPEQEITNITNDYTYRI